MGFFESSFDSSFEPLPLDRLATLSDFQVEFPRGGGEGDFGPSSESSLSMRFRASCLMRHIEPYYSLITTLKSSSYKNQLKYSCYLIFLEIHQVTLFLSLLTALNLST